MSLLGLLAAAHSPPPASDPWDADPARPVVHIIPHQDDEILTAGAAILADVAAGRDVYAYLSTRGERSGVRTGPELASLLGYTPTEEEFSAARDREFIACVERMGATPIVPAYADREPDGASEVPRIVAAVTTHCPPGAVVAGCALTDYHRDHRNTGAAAIALRDQGWAHAARLYLAHERLTTHATGHAMTAQGQDTPVTRWHQGPYIDQDVPAGMWGIGYISVPEMFDYQVSQPAERSWAYYHVP